jgi:hypothetical protein
MDILTLNHANHHPAQGLNMAKVFEQTKAILFPLYEQLKNESLPSTTSLKVMAGKTFLIMLIQAI